MGSSKINSVKFYNKFRPEPSNFLLGNIQDEIDVEIDFSFSEYVLASTDNPITMNYTDGVLGDGWIYDPAGRFENFKIGDHIIVGNYIISSIVDSSRVITDKTGPTLIKLDADVSGRPNNDVTTQGIFSIKEPITGVSFNQNLIENSEPVNFVSKIDNESIITFDGPVVDAANTTPLFLIQSGNIEARINEASIEGAGITNTYLYESRFIIKTKIFITPFFDVNNLVDPYLIPNYYSLLKCLKYVFRINGYYNFSDPNRSQSITSFSVLGNTGWFNENFNGGTPVYSIESVVYKKSDNLTIKPSLEYTTLDQYVEVTINSSTGSFSNGNTQFALQICKVPYDQTEISSNGRNFYINFCFDRAFQTVGASSVNGFFFGGVNQSIKAVTGQFINTSKIKVLFRVSFAPEVISIYQESEIPKFLISVSVQKHSLPTLTSDRVNCLVDLKEFFIDTSDPGMIGIEQTKFLRHYENDPVIEGVTDRPIVRPSDEMTSYNRFFIDTNGRESDVIKIKSITAKIKVKNALTGAEFDLDTWSQNVLTSPLGSDGWQFINVNSNRPFHIPASEIRRPVKIKRRPDLDGAGLVYYDIYFPYIFRWEYFIPLSDADTVFFNPLQPNNGQNHFWHHYQGGHWNIKYEVSIVAIKNGVLQGYRIEKDFVSKDWNSNTQVWTNAKITSHDKDTLTEIIDLSIPKKYVQGYKSSLIRCDFTNTADINQADYAIVAHVGIWETDTYTGIRRFCYLYPMTTDTWMKSLDSSDKIVQTQPNSKTVRGEFLLDHTKIPLSAESFWIQSRIYKIKEGGYETFFKLKESGELKQLENGLNKILD